MEETDLASSLAALEAMQDDADPAAFSGLVSRLRLKLSVACGRLEQVIRDGERLLETHRELAGEDFTYTMNRAVVLAPMKEQKQSWEDISARLRQAERAVRLSASCEEAHRLLRVLRSLGTAGGGAPIPPENV